MNFIYLVETPASYFVIAENKEFLASVIPLTGDDYFASKVSKQTIAEFLRSSDAEGINVIRLPSDTRDAPSSSSEEFIKPIRKSVREISDESSSSREEVAKPTGKSQKKKRDVSSSSEEVTQPTRKPQKKKIDVSSSSEEVAKPTRKPTKEKRNVSSSSEEIAKPTRKPTKEKRNVSSSSEESTEAIRRSTKKPTKSEPKSKRNDNIDFVIYNDKSVVVFGEATRDIKEKLKSTGGRYNANLTIDGAKKPGWIFSNKKEDELIKMLKRDPRTMKKTRDISTSSASSEESINKRPRKSQKESSDIDFVIYNEKSIAVVGEGTRDIKDDLKDVGGRFNASLTIDGKRKAGWIFSGTKEKELIKLLGIKPRKMTK